MQRMTADDSYRDSLPRSSAAVREAARVGAGRLIPLGWLRWLALAFFTLLLDISVSGVAPWRSLGPAQSEDALASSGASARFDRESPATPHLGHGDPASLKFALQAVDSDGEDDSLVDPLGWTARTPELALSSRLMDEGFRVHALIVARAGATGCRLPRGPPEFQTIG